MDAYHGMFRLNLTTGIVSHMFGPHTFIKSELKKENNLELNALLPPKFFNDFDISQDGCIYFSDSSYKWSRSNNRWDIL